MANKPGKADYPRIGVFSPGASIQGRGVFRALQARGRTEAWFFDTDLRRGDPTHVDGEGLSFGGKDLTSLDAAYVHGFSYMNPVIPSEPGLKDWSVWSADHVEDQQRFSYLFSLFTEMERRGVRVINPPGIHVHAFMKPALLESLRTRGIQAPPSVCTNDPEEARGFCARHGQVVWRPVTGRAAWQLFGEKQAQSLMHHGKPPVWLARLENGPLVRAYFFEGEPIMLLGHQAPHPGPPERLETVFERECPQALDMLARLYEQSGLAWGMAVFVQGAEGPVLYDLDPDPLFEWLPAEHQQQLTERLAQALCGGERRRTGQPLLEPRQRPALFTRRMLAPLFAFEQSKKKQ